MKKRNPVYGAVIALATGFLFALGSSINEVQALNGQEGDHFELQVEGQVLRQLGTGIFEQVYLPSRPITVKLLYVNVQGTQNFPSDLLARLEVWPIQQASTVYAAPLQLVQDSVQGWRGMGDLSTKAVGYADIPANTLSPGKYVLRVGITTNLSEANGGFSSDADAIIEVAVASGSTGGTTTQQPETPWGTNAYGTQVTYGLNYRYTMGYRFIPQSDGKITKLGGLFQGTKTVYLYDNSGSVLAFASVAGNSKTWAYTPITPVSVRSGQTYIVAVALAGSGGALQVLTSPLPKTFGNVRILDSVYQYDPNGVGTMPTSGFATYYMYGQADVEFVPGS